MHARIELGLAEGKIVPAWRQPFDKIALANEPRETESHAFGPENGLNQNWLPDMDADLNHKSAWSGRFRPRSHLTE